MKAYYYRLLLSNGRVKTGLVHLSVERDFSARLWLERRYDCVVLTLRRLPGWLAELHKAVKGFFRPDLRSEDLSGLLRDMAVMVRGGVPMLEALRTIAEEGEIGQDRQQGYVARLLLEDLEAGASVSSAFSRHPDIFPDAVRNLVNIGDETGEMDRMLMESAEHVERITNISRDAKRALIYPLFVFTAILGAAGFWVYYVIPNLAQLFKQLHAKLPPITLAVIAFSDWLTQHVALFLILIVLGIIGIWFAFRRSQTVRRFAYRMAHRIPVIKVLMRSSGMAFFTEHLALLIRAGLDIVSSLAVLERSMTDEYFRERIKGMRNVVSRGERLTAAMRQVGGFPPMAVRMISVGEETGSLSDQLQYLADEYRKRFEHLVASLAELIKPLVILLAGALFIVLIIALLLPVYDLVRQAMVNQGVGG